MCRLDETVIDSPGKRAVAFAVFTFAGSGVTIVSMGGLMLPMLIKARYPERFSIGLINGSGSLGLLFPSSLPVILYAVYAKTVQIDTLFVVSCPGYSWWPRSPPGASSMA
jgi:TRAP-type C4-dicarboxylate transport system permease large subunit